jgi:hypothetical protein
MLKSNKEVISLKIKAYVAILCSHLTVLTALCTPIIRVAEVKMAAVGQTETDSYYLNIFDFARVNLNSFSTFLMLFLTVVHLFGVANAVYGLAKKNYSHISINLTFINALASAFMGALLLYSKSEEKIKSNHYCLLVYWGFAFPAF